MVCSDNPAVVPCVSFAAHVSGLKDKNDCNQNGYSMLSVPFKKGMYILQAMQQRLYKKIFSEKK